MKLYKNKASLVVLLSSLFLVACGGSSSGASGTKDDPAKTLVDADFNNHSFVVKGNEQVADSFTFFDKDKTGVELTGDFKGKSFVKKELTWGIDNKKLRVTFNGGVGEYSFNREKLENNLYIGRKNGKLSYLHKALPLKLKDLDGKIFKFDLSGLSEDDNPRGCTVRTLKVEKNKAYLKEICARYFENNKPIALMGKAQQITVNEDIKASIYANTVEFSFVAPNKDTILMALISGDFKSEAEVALVYQGSFKAVQIEKMKMVEKEAF